MQFRVVSYGFRVIEQGLRDMGIRAEQNREALDTIVERIMGIEQDVFDSQGRRSGAEWPTITNDWLLTKVRLNLDPRVLHATGALRESMTNRHSRNLYVRRDRSRLVLKSQLPYSGLHQTGTGRMPARPFIRFVQRDIAEFATIYQRHVFGRFGSFGQRTRARRS